MLVLDAIISMRRGILYVRLLQSLDKGQKSDPRAKATLGKLRGKGLERECALQS